MANIPDPDCWLRNTEVRAQLIQYFAEIDKDLSSYYEANPYIREEHIEGRFTTLVEAHGNDRLNMPLARIQQERERINLRPFNFRLKISHITAGESKSGADLGLVAELDLPGEYRLRKAVIVQDKRLSPTKNGRFREESEYSEVYTNKDNPQYKRMLDLTPSSYYFLFNPQQLRVKKGVKTLGTRVLSAEYIAGRGNAISQAALTAREAYTFGKILSNWMVEDFICCKVGDVRESVIQTALGQNPDFLVRYSVIISITSDNITPDIFSRTS